MMIQHVRCNQTILEEFATFSAVCRIEVNSPVSDPTISKPSFVRSIRQTSSSSIRRSKWQSVHELLADFLHLVLEAELHDVKELSVASKSEDNLTT